MMFNKRRLAQISSLSFSIFLSPRKLYFNIHSYFEIKLWMSAAVAAIYTGNICNQSHDTKTHEGLFFNIPSDHTRNSS